LGIHYLHRIVEFEHMVVFPDVTGNDGQDQVDQAEAEIE
jgi:hypothetical protein